MFGSHLKFLESFYKTVMPECDVDVLELINNATVEMYEARGINEYTDCSNYKPKDFPIFEDLYALINDRLAQEENILFRNNLLRAQMYLKKFASGGRYADIWNEPSTLLTTSDFVVFNFQSLFANKNQIVANAQMLLLFRFLEQQIINIREANNASGSVRHIMVFADEAHLFIDKNCPTAVNFFYQMNKRIRSITARLFPPRRIFPIGTLPRICVIRPASLSRTVSTISSSDSPRWICRISYPCSAGRAALTRRKRI